MSTLLTAAVVICGAGIGFAGLIVGMLAIEAWDQWREYRKTGVLD